MITSHVRSARRVTNQVLLHTRVDALLQLLVCVVGSTEAAPESETTKEMVQWLTAMYFFRPLETARNAE